MDIKILNKYLVVINADNSVAVNDFITRARCETLQRVQVYNTINDVKTDFLPELPAKGEQVEKDKLYKYKGKVVHCTQTHTMDTFNNNMFIKQESIIEPVEGGIIKKSK